VDLVVEKFNDFGSNCLTGIIFRGVRLSLVRLIGFNDGNDFVRIDGDVGTAYAVWIDSI
jgi:hypothetical protein